jgi:uncharacterized FlaG/YvyC family protein
MVEDHELNIKKIDYTSGFGKQDKQNQKKGKKKHSTQEDEAKDHFEDIAQSVRQANSVLEEKKSPYRFYISRKNHEIFIHLVILDEKGKLKRTIKEKITHQEFSKIIEHIEKLDGFLLDYTV